MRGGQPSAGPATTAAEPDFFNMEAKLHCLAETPLYPRLGEVTKVVGLTVESRGPNAALGERCTIELSDGRHRDAEVVGFRDEHLLLMPLDDLEGLRPGLRVTAEGRPLSVPVGPGLLGRVLDGLGRPLDERGPLRCRERRPLAAHPPHPLRRRRITKILPLGVRVMDGLLSCGRGQRLGVFGGSGVGKSMLLGMFARNTSADVNVIALIGERGREVREFLERNLGAEGLKRSVVIAVTSDRSPIQRVKGALTAAAVAEAFRDEGRHVLLMMDSVTRFCLAQREIGLAVGEPPATRGYTPSVFSLLPYILERAGAGERGSITGLYTVLVEGDDMNEPVADAVRSILDGHVILSRELATVGHYPAVDVLQSQSRLFLDLVEPRQRQAAVELRRLLSEYHRSRDLLDVGAYVAGSNPLLDRALRAWDDITAFLQQDVNDRAGYEETVERLVAVAGAK